MLTVCDDGEEISEKMASCKQDDESADKAGSLVKGYMPGWVWVMGDGAWCVIGKTWSNWTGLLRDG